MRIREIAQARPRFGHHRVYVMLRREGWRVNLKRVRRLYRLEGLQVRPAGTEAATSRAASRPGARADRVAAALEHGLRA
jgi:transposase InsO family protein